MSIVRGRGRKDCLAKSHFPWGNHLYSEDRTVSLPKSSENRNPESIAESVAKTDWLKEPEQQYPTRSLFGEAP